MRRLITLLSGVLLTASASLMAHGAGGCSCHGDHGHTPPHGGVVEETTRHHHIELVGDDEQVSLWLLDEHMEAVTSDTISLAAQIVLPRGEKKTIPLTLRKRGTAYVADVEIPGRVHRYGVHVTVSDGGWSETVEFQLEP